MRGMIEIWVCNLEQPNAGNTQHWLPAVPRIGEQIMLPKRGDPVQYKLFTIKMVRWWGWRDEREERVDLDVEPIEKIR